LVSPAHCERLSAANLLCSLHPCTAAVQLNHLYWQHMHTTYWCLLASLVAEFDKYKDRGRWRSRVITCAARIVSLPLMNPLLQLSAFIRMLRNVVDPGVLLQHAPAQQPGQVAPGGRPSGPILLVKRPLICEAIAPLHNLPPANCLSMPA